MTAPVKIFIESTISISLVTEDPLLTGASTWAAFSASGMRSLRLPSKAGRLVIGADGDDAGRAAAHALGPLREALEATAGETQCPVAIAAASELAVASLAVQAHADILTLGGIRPISLYLLTSRNRANGKAASIGCL